MVAGSVAESMSQLAPDLQQAGVVGVLRASSPEKAVAATLAAHRGGLKAIEITFTTPEAAQAILQLTAQLNGKMLIGAGTVMNQSQALEAISAGAGFLVSPHLGTDVLEVALEHQVPYLPGVITPTEIQRALRLGATLLKLFPMGSSGGLKYLKDLLGPFPDLRCMVTGGIEPAEVPLYRNSGALAVGLGSNLFPRAAIETGNWQQVEEATQAALRQAGFS